MEKGGTKRGREASMCGCLSQGPNWGPGLQPRQVLRLGIELATLWSEGWQSTEPYQPEQNKVFKCLKQITYVYIIYKNIKK